MESLLEINQQLNALGYTLEAFSHADENALYDIFRNVVDSGSQFPYGWNTLQEFRSQFLGKRSNVYVCHSSDNEVIGGFYIKPNFPHRSILIANAAYMVHEAYRGHGIGTLMIKASLHIAKELGFQAMQFNLVFSKNIPAINLYQKLGFDIIGTIPEVIQNTDGSWQEGYIMYRKLENL